MRDGPRSRDAFLRSGSEIVPFHGDVLGVRPDDAFDAVVLWSVFTHLYPDTIEHYLHEIHRALKPGGRLGAPFFVLDPHAFSEIDAGQLNIQDIVVATAV